MDPAAQPQPLAQLFTETREDLLRFFARRHGTTQSAEDLVQDTFLLMTKAIRPDIVLSHPRGYLFGIARKVSAAAWRATRQTLTDPINGDLPEIATTTPDERVEAARETIKNLAPLQREIMDLRFTSSLSYAEIAEALGIPVGTVRSRLHHAIAEVRRQIENE